MFVLRLNWILTPTLGSALGFLLLKLTPVFKESCWIHRRWSVNPGKPHIHTREQAKFIRVTNSESWSHIWWFQSIKTGLKIFDVPLRVTKLSMDDFCAGLGWIQNTCLLVWLLIVFLRWVAHLKLRQSLVIKFVQNRWGKIKEKQLQVNKRRSLLVYGSFLILVHRRACICGANLKKH